SISVDGNGNMTVRGIVYVNGDINLNRASHGSGFTYSTPPTGGTLVATGNIAIHCNVLSRDTFPTSNVLGFVARHQIQLATGGGGGSYSCSCASLVDPERLNA